MSHALPVVSTNIGANPEFISEGVTGLLVREAELRKDFGIPLQDELPLWPHERWIKSMHSIRQLLVGELTNQVSRLVENEQLRREMGRAGMREITNGTFSIASRNKTLKDILDRADGDARL